MQKLALLSSQIGKVLCMMLEIEVIVDRAHCHIPQMNLLAQLISCSPLAESRRPACLSIAAGLHLAVIGWSLHVPDQQSQTVFSAQCL